MGGILDSRGGTDAGAWGAKTLHVRGFPYSNTAGKFWTSILDEVTATYPAGTVLEMVASAGGLLVPDLLMPEQMLQRDMDRLSQGDGLETIQDAMAVLELIGPPSAITLRLLPPGPDGSSHELVLDYLDADLMPFLLAWLLEWASVPDVLWNLPSVRGTFAGDDKARGYRYLVAFELSSQLLSEELYRRTLRVSFRREILGKAVPVPPGDPAPVGTPPSTGG